MAVVSRCPTARRATAREGRAAARRAVAVDGDRGCNVDHHATDPQDGVPDEVGSKLFMRVNRPRHTIPLLPPHA